jgi:hypothetical protein
MFSSTRPPPLLRHTHQHHKNPQTTQNWNAPQPKPLPAPPQQTLTQEPQTNPYQAEWIQEWRKALTQSAYPLWEEWFRKRDWECQGHLTTHQPSLFKQSLHIGEIDLQHTLSVQGSTRLNGDLHIFGSIWHHPQTNQLTKTATNSAAISAITDNNSNNDGSIPEWELTTPVEAYSWNEIKEQSQIQLRPLNHRGWWSTWDGQKGIGLLQDTDSQTVQFVGWTNHEDPEKGTPFPHLTLNVPYLHTKNIQTESLFIHRTLEAPASGLVIRAPHSTHEGNLSVQGTFNVNQHFQIDEKGEVFFRGAYFNCSSLMRCEQIITYDSFVCPRMFIDDFIETKKMRILDSCHIGGALIADSSQGITGFQFKVAYDPARPQNAAQWLTIPNAFRNSTVTNLNAELWNGQPLPNVAEEGDFVLCEKAQSLSHKSLGTDLDARNHRIVNVLPPKESSDVATKQYVDEMRMPFQIFDSVQQWIPLSLVQKWGQFSPESQSWSGTFHKGAPSHFHAIQPNFLVGVYPDQLSQQDWHSLSSGIGLFQVIECEPNQDNPSLTSFTWILQTEFYQWATIDPNSKDAQSIWVGGPEGTRGGAHLFMIQTHRTHQQTIQLKWNALLSWKGVTPSTTTEDSIATLTATLQEVEQRLRALEG